MTRSSYKIEESRLVTVWFPRAVLPRIDKALRRLDTDRSKFIRQAVREKMERAGVKVEEEAA